MKKWHELHRHPDLPHGWWIAVVAEDSHEPIAVVEYLATIYDLNRPYCQAWGDTPEAAERRACLLFRALPLAAAEGGPF